MGTVTYAGTNGVPIKPLYIQQGDGGEPTLAEKIEP